MKNLLCCICLCVPLLYSCDNTLLDELWESNKAIEEDLMDNTSRIDSLETLCSMLNTNLSALKTLVEVLQEYDYITSISPIYEDGVQIGYTIDFADNGPVTIYNGEDGEKTGSVPEIGIRQDSDGTYYWTIDNEWLLDSEGQKVSCEGKDATAPQLRINEEWWEISYDEGVSWTRLGKADGEGGDSSVFSSVEASESEVKFTLSDGTSFSIPLYTRLSIEFDIQGDETGVEARKEITVNYYITGATEKTVVTASSDGNYKVTVNRRSYSEGAITITSPKFYEDGHITVTVFDGKGYSFNRIINFYEREIHFPEGLEYRLPASGGTISIPVSLNFEYNTKIPSPESSWLSLGTTTKAEMHNETITVHASMNEEFSERSGKIQLFALNNPDEHQSEITVYQSPAYFSIERTRYVITHEQQTFSTVVTSSLDISLNITQNGNWLTSGLSGRDGDKYTLTTTVDRNNQQDIRTATVTIYNGDGSRILGTIDIVQVPEGSENPDDMIFNVRANHANDYVAYIPLSGEIDCIVDWGDGSEPEHITSSPVYHEYTHSTADYTVRISGKVTALNSSNIPAPSVTEVIQWGRTGLNSMNCAFKDNGLLTSIVGDNNNSFSEVTDFSHAFNNCILLETIPENLFIASTNITQFSETFSHCISLLSIPQDLFKYCTKVTSFNSTFNYCRSLTEIPENLFKHCPNVTAFEATFCDCQSLVTIPETLFSNCPKVRMFYYTFSGCISLLEIPEKIFLNCPEVNNFMRVFMYCESLRYVPAGLFDGNRKVINFDTAFYACASLNSESPYTIINGEKCHIYERINFTDYFTTPVVVGMCFTGCDNLSDFMNIPDSWK